MFEAVKVQKCIMKILRWNLISATEKEQESLPIELDEFRPSCSFSIGVPGLIKGPEIVELYNLKRLSKQDAV